MRPERIPNDSPRKMRALQIERAAMQMRVSGFDYETIAESINKEYQTAMDPALAAKAVKRGLARWRGDCKEKAAQLIELDMQALDVCLEIALGVARRGAIAGKVDGIMAAMKVMERKARLLGLDAAIKAEVSVKQTEIDPRNLSNEELNTFAALAAKASAGDLPNEDEEDPVADYQEGIDWANDGGD